MRRLHVPLVILLGLLLAVPACRDRDPAEINPPPIPETIYDMIVLIILDTSGSYAGYLERKGYPFCMHTIDTLFRNPSLKTVAPRLGFSWDVLGNGKTAVRGGAGIFYDDILVSTPFVQNTAVRVPPYFNRGGLVGSNAFVVAFPDAYTSQRAALAGQAQLEGIQYDLKQPYMEKWNVNLQRELAGKTTVEIGYSGSHGANLVRQVFTNGRVARASADGSGHRPSVFLSASASARPRRIAANVSCSDCGNVPAST